MINESAGLLSVCEIRTSLCEGNHDLSSYVWTNIKRAAVEFLLGFVTLHQITARNRSECCFE